MLILLPPSEGKTAAAKGHPFDLQELQFSELNPAREEVLTALAHISNSPDALAQLGVGASLAAEVERNTRLRDEPSAPAHTVYSGVLYDALGYRTMTATQKRKADAAVVVISALWGAIGFADSIPAYRLSMSVGLPETGKLASYWKKRLNETLDAHAEGHLLVDCRSSTYSAAWTPEPARTVVVNVFQERNGKRTVVSHFAKHTRGELARHLLTRRGKAPETPAALLKAAQEVWHAELVDGTARKAHALNIVLGE
ncbi:peroxide stress protein YaaA [Arthrobacter sp. CAU 1506]|uniref:YaaA family protein n=1 Tax=Arthrobacter sp. CAU 1506 TaxID=2560052 RepID=UPI0010AC114D|nr:peroxide stress protein YaaA [Arthrobacter sp. CAU 1506]TJY67411.1 peroxide stress protein YaaA [Arthrobacter sp. CAU 1506]